MPGTQDHRLKAAENEAFAGGVASNGAAHLDWAVTGYFYAALHHVTALLHSLGCQDGDLRTHARRQRQIATRLPAEQQLYDDYRQLQDDSEAARYDCRAFSEQDVNQLIAQHFAPLKTRVQALLPP